MRWQVQEKLLSLESFRVPRIGGSQDGEPRNRRANATYLEMLQAQAGVTRKQIMPLLQSSAQAHTRYQLGR